MNGNANLADVLQVFLNDQGKIYVSNAGDPLVNTLYLNFKNIGLNPLFNDAYGPPPESYSPTVQVSFVYGSDDSSGILAPDNDENADAQGSAWNIVGSIDAGQGNDWNIDAPDKEENNPIWELTPNELNVAVIKTGEDADIVFSFSNIISFTPSGNTQMTVLFTGFMLDANTPYEDTTFTLNIVKVTVPALRGILSFYSDVQIINTTDFEGTINFRWMMSFVHTVILSASIPDCNPKEINYDNQKVIAAGNCAFQIPEIPKSTLITMTLKAYDANGNFLNARQSMVYLQSTFFTDPDGKNYPTVVVGSLLWMAANLDYCTPEGTSGYYADDPINQDQYGRYYTWEDASKNIPEGWRLPTAADWQDLIIAFGGNVFHTSYNALLAGGGSLFGAQLGGYANPDDDFDKKGVAGYFWTSTLKQNPDTYNYILFNSVKREVNPFNLVASNRLNVRYVKDISA